MQEVLWVFALVFSVEPGVINGGVMEKAPEVVHKRGQSVCIEAEAVPEAFSRESTRLSWALKCNTCCEFLGDVSSSSSSSYYLLMYIVKNKDEPIS